MHWLWVCLQRKRDCCGPVWQGHHAHSSCNRIPAGYGPEGVGNHAESVCDLSPVPAHVHESTGAWKSEIDPIVHCREGFWVAEQTVANTKARFRHRGFTWKIKVSRSLLRLQHWIKQQLLLKVSLTEKCYCVMPAPLQRVGRLCSRLLKWIGGCLVHFAHFLYVG